jgi:hypothetical protein
VIIVIVLIVWLVGSLTKQIQIKRCYENYDVIVIGTRPVWTFCLRRVSRAKGGASIKGLWRHLSMSDVCHPNIDLCGRQNKRNESEETGIQK